MTEETRKDRSQLFNPFRAGSQNHRILELLKQTGSVSNVDLVMMGMLSYTKRLSQVRRAVNLYGWTVKAHRPDSAKKGVVWYHLEEYGGLREKH